MLSLVVHVSAMQAKKAERALKTIAKQRAAAEAEREGYVERLPALKESIPRMREMVAEAENAVEEIFEANKGKTAGLQGELKAKQVCIGDSFHLSGVADACVCVCVSV